MAARRKGARRSTPRWPALANRVLMPHVVRHRDTQNARAGDGGGGRRLGAYCHDAGRHLLGDRDLQRHAGDLLPVDAGHFGHHVLGAVPAGLDHLSTRRL